MAIRNDYLLSMITSFTESLTQTELEGHGGLSVSAMDTYGDIVGRILDMPADAVLELSPSSLVTMMQISAVDEKLAVYMVYTLQRMADVCGVENSALADVRRAQARAIADAYGFPETEVPPEVQDAREERDASPSDSE
ncbi:MAG: hypothetical protein SOI26_07240 [Coriobacteriales bacterium]|jgi:hypothetical protein